MVVCVAEVITLIGCAAASDGSREHWVSHHSLFHRIGRQSTIEAIVDGFLDAALEDHNLDFFRVRTACPRQGLEENVQRLRARLVDYLCMATGGTHVYEGADIKTAHEGMNITSEEYKIALRHFSIALDNAKVRSGEREQFMGLLHNLGRSIIENGETPSSLSSGAEGKR